MFLITEAVHSIFTSTMTFLRHKCILICQFVLLQNFILVGFEVIFVQGLARIRMNPLNSLLRATRKGVGKTVIYYEVYHRFELF
jgi:hypothetical protein